MHSIHRDKHTSNRLHTKMQTIAKNTRTSYNPNITSILPNLPMKETRTLKETMLKNEVPYGKNSVFLMVEVYGVLTYPKGQHR